MEENPQILAEIFERILMDSHNLKMKFSPWFSLPLKCNENNLSCYTVVSGLV